MSARGGTKADLHRAIDRLQAENIALRNAASGGPPAERPPEPENPLGIIAGLDQLASEDPYNGAMGDTCRRAAALLRAAYPAGVAERRDPPEPSKEAIAAIHRIMRNDLGPVAREYVAELLQTYEALRGAGPEPTAGQPSERELALARFILKEVGRVGFTGEYSLIQQFDRSPEAGALRAGGPAMSQWGDCSQCGEPLPPPSAAGHQCSGTKISPMANSDSLSGGGPAREEQRQTLEPSGESIVGKIATLEGFLSKSEKADAEKWNLLLQWVERARLDGVCAGGSPPAPHHITEG